MSSGKPVLKRQNTGLIVEEEIYMLDFKDLSLLSQIGKGNLLSLQILSIYLSKKISNNILFFVIIM